MRYGAGVLLVVLAAGQAWAQSGARIESGLGTLAQAGQGCPVGFSAQRRSPVELSRAEDGGWKKNQGQGIRLSFGRGAEKIVKIDVTLHGLSPDARVMPVGDKSDDLTEIFQLVRGADGRLRTEIDTQKMGTVRLVDLTAIEFADGTTWRAYGASRCRVEPDMLMLVAGAR